MYIVNFSTSICKLAEFFNHNFFWKEIIVYVFSNVMAHIVDETRAYPHVLRAPLHTNQESRPGNLRALENHAKGRPVGNKNPSFDQRTHIL